jgi:flagellar basal-body rod modification protein FlgD
MDVATVGTAPRTQGPDSPQGSATLALADFGQFLNLFVTQLKFQDPLSPMSGEDFLAQTAQFSSVEQLVSLNRRVLELAEANEAATWSSAAALIGRTVSASAVDGDGNPVEATGRVVQVDYGPRGDLILGLEDGTQVPYTDLTSISET